MCLLTPPHTETISFRRVGIWWARDFGSCAARRLRCVGTHGSKWRESKWAEERTWRNQKKDRKYRLIETERERSERWARSLWRTSFYEPSPLLISPPVAWNKNIKRKDRKKNPSPTRGESCGHQIRYEFWFLLLLRESRSFRVGCRTGAHPDPYLF